MQLVENKDRMHEMVHKISKEQALTLSLNGLDFEVFRGALVEAILTNTKLESVGVTELYRALRKCCADGLLPNGREACLIVKKNGTVSYLAMKEGLMRVIAHGLGAELRSGHVKEGQVIHVTHHTHKDDEITWTTDWSTDGSEKVIGSWSWIKVPGRTAEVHPFYLRDILAAKLKSNVANFKGSPWDIWMGAMAEKAVIKSHCNRLRYLIPKDDKGNRIRSVLEEDEYTTPEVDTETITVQGTEIKDSPKIESKPEVTVTPKTKTSKKTKAATKTKTAAKKTKSTKTTKTSKPATKTKTAAKSKKATAKPAEETPPAWVSDTNIPDQVLPESAFDPSNLDDPF